MHVIIDGIKYSLENGVATIVRQDENLFGDIVIPEMVTHEGKVYVVGKVRDWAFAHTGITSLKLPGSITALGKHCFEFCWYFVSIKLPGSIQALGDFCFNACFRLASIILPNSINFLGTGCFNGCNSLSKVTCAWPHASDVKTGRDVFFFINPEATLYVPKGTKSIYEGSGCWSDFKHIVEL